MRLSGTLLDIEHKAGEFINSVGEKISYDFTLLHILDGREVHKVRLPKEVNALDLPIGRGEVVDIDVTVPSNTKIIFSGLSVLTA